MATPIDPERDPLFRALILIMAVAIVVVLAFDAISHQSGVAGAASPQLTGSTLAAAAPPASTYVPTTRSFLVTTVPLLVHEQTAAYDYLKRDFSPKGLLAGKEIWGFSPSNFTVYEGDTVHVTVVNPSGDDHTFTLPTVGFNLYVKAQSKASGSFVVPKAGPFGFVCTIAEHSPYMSGQLVVLPDSAAPEG